MRGKRQHIDKQQWKDNTILLFIMAAIWIITGLSINPEIPSIAILVFITGFTLINPIFYYTKNIFHKKIDIKYSNTQVIISFLSLGMAIGLVPVFFVFIENADIFFPAFGFVQGFVLLLAGKQIRSASIRLTGFLVLINAIRYFQSLSFNQLGLEYSTALIFFIVGAYSAIQNWSVFTIAAKQNTPKALPNSP